MNVVGRISLLRVFDRNQWDNREERSGNNARAFFDREMLTEKGKEILSNSVLTFDAAAMRFTGTFDGVEFTPIN